MSGFVRGWLRIFLLAFAFSAGSPSGCATITGHSRATDGRDGESAVCVVAPACPAEAETTGTRRI